MQRDLPGVLDSVFDPKRDVRRLVLFKHEHFLAPRDACGACHHDPVLSTMVMQLK